MLTVKLYGRNPAGSHTTKIIEGAEVDVHCLRPGELWEIAIIGGASGQQAFYVANPQKPGRPEGFAEEIVFWDSAYIENAAGKTTDQVRF